MDIVHELISGHEPILVLTPVGTRIDAAAAIGFKDRMRELSTNGPDRVVLNLAGIDFIDSSGLGAIVASLKQMREGQILELAGAGGTVEKVLRLTRMDSVFRLHDNIASLAGGTAA